MSSTTGNPNNNPWGQYDSYKDCSQGVCSVYCPQWCYIIFPPPPSFFLDEEDDSSSSDFSPLLIALIGILASAFILVSYYTLISKYCHRRRNNSTTTTTRDQGFSSSVTDTWQASNQNQNPVIGGGDGLDESLIKSITVYKFRKGDGFVESADCSVCLSEFQEDERLRLLPKCNHAFHVPCIDTWLKSHSNCPLCRAFITGITAGESNQQIQTESTENNQTGDSDSDSDSDSVVVNVDLETRSGSETVSRSTAKPPEMEGLRDGGEEEVNSGTVVLIADILREIEDDDDDDEEESAGVGTSRRVEEGDGGEKTPTPSPSLESAANQTNGISNFLVRSSMMAMKRSVSTGKFVRSRNYRLPN